MTIPHCCRCGTSAKSAFPAVLPVAQDDPSQQAGYRRQYAEGIASEHDDIGGGTVTAAFYDIGDMRQRAGGAGIFGKGVVSQVNPAGMGINCHLFQDGTEAAGGRIYLRLGLFEKIDDLVSLLIEPRRCVPSGRQ